MQPTNGSTNGSQTMQPSQTSQTSQISYAQYPQHTGEDDIHNKMNSDITHMYLEETLPRKTDATRMSNLAMVLDELCHAKHKYVVSQYEFKMCGGFLGNDKDYPLYFFLVWAVRDLVCFFERKHMPEATQVARASRIYTFHEDTSFCSEIESDMKNHECYKILRMLIVLTKVRAIFKNGTDKIDVASIWQKIANTFISRDEFELCGGSKKKKQVDLSLVKQLRCAKRDITVLLRRGRAYPYSTIAKASLFLHQDKYQRILKYIHQSLNPMSDNEDINVYLPVLDVIYDKDVDADDAVDDAVDDDYLFGVVEDDDAADEDPMDEDDDDTAEHDKQVDANVDDEDYDLVD